MSQLCGMKRTEQHFNSTGHLAIIFSVLLLISFLLLISLNGYKPYAGIEWLFWPPLVFLLLRHGSPVLLYLIFLPFRLWFNHRDNPEGLPSYTYKNKNA